MSIDQIQVQISIARAGVPRAGFGKPLILSYDAPFAERYREYADPSEYAEDGGATDSPTYLSLTAFFSQTPKPSRVGVGRAINKPTQRYVIGVTDVRSEWTYELDVEGEDFDASEVEYVSGAAATIEQIHNGLVAGLNAVVDKTFTATFAALVYADKVFTAGADDIIHAAANLLKTGDGPLQVITSAADLPLNLVIATPYYWIRIDADTGYFASSLANALAGIHVDIADAGTGVHTIIDVPGTTVRPSDPFTVTLDTAGKFASIEADIVTTAIAQTHAAPDVASDLAAIRNINSSWYAIHTFFNSKAYVGAVSVVAAALGVVYWFDTCDSDPVVTAYVAGVSDDVGATQLGLGRSMVTGAYHQRPAAMLSAAHMGRWLPTLPGESNPAWKTLEGVEPTILTSTHKTNLTARRMNYYYETAVELPITWKGMVFSTVYKYIDVRRNVDWLTNEIQANIAGKFAAAEGIGYDDPGIQVAAGGLEESLQLAIERKVLPVNPKYTMEVPLAEDVSSIDRENRALTQLKFNAGLRGFINEVIPIAGTVTL